MKVPRKLILITITVLVLLIGGGIAIAKSTPTARADRQLNLGNKYLQEGKYQEAILAFEKAIQIEPKNISARLGLGQVFLATKDFDKAETILKEVIDIDHKNIQARDGLFKVYLTEGDLKSANDILKEITAIDPSKDIKQFNADLESAKAISISKASYDQGIEQMNDKQYLEAVDSFQKVTKEDAERYNDAQTKSNECKKSFVDATLQKAKDAASNKDFKTALGLLEQVLKVESSNAEALKLKDTFLTLKKQAEEKVLEEQRKAKELTPLEAAKLLSKNIDNPTAYFYLVYDAGPKNYYIGLYQGYSSAMGSYTSGAGGYYVDKISGVKSEPGDAPNIDFSNYLLVYSPQ